MIRYGGMLYPLPSGYALTKANRDFIIFLSSLLSVLFDTDVWKEHQVIYIHISHIQNKQFIV